MTRSSANWAAQPGGYDALHCERRIWPSDSPHGIPSLQPQRFDLPADFRLLPYRSRLDRLDPNRDLCHFYLDDYRFESTWTRLDVGARHVAGYFATLTPDFSLYPDWPIAAQLWNTYRSRWLGRFWQEGGLRVIPTVNWSDWRSFAFCFEGIPLGQLLSIGTADCRRAHVQRRFDLGLWAMLERLQPRALIVYGHLQPRHRRRIERDGCHILEIAPAWEQWRTRSGSTLDITESRSDQAAPTAR